MGKGGKGGQLSWWERDGESSLCQKVAAIFDLTWRRVGESGRHGVRQSGSQAVRDSRSRRVEESRLSRLSESARRQVILLINFLPTAKGGVSQGGWNR